MTPSDTGHRPQDHEINDYIAVYRAQYITCKYPALHYKMGFVLRLCTTAEKLNSVFMGRVFWGFRAVEIPFRKFTVLYKRKLNSGQPLSCSRLAKMVLEFQGLNVPHTGLSHGKYDETTGPRGPGTRPDSLTRLLPAIPGKTLPERCQGRHRSSWTFGATTYIWHPFVGLWAESPWFPQFSEAWRKGTQGAGVDLLPAPIHRAATGKKGQKRQTAFKAPRLTLEATPKWR